MISVDTKLCCPKCGLQSHLASFQDTADILELSRLAAKFGRNWAWTEEYLHCFRASPDRPLRPARMKILLGEILNFIEDNGFRIDKQWHPIRPDAVFEAIRHVAQTNKTGFKNHNYLKRVAIDCNRKMIERDDKEQEKRVQEAVNRNRDPKGPEKLKELMAKIGDTEKR